MSGGSPKPKWAGRLNSAMRRSSSILTFGRPSTDSQLSSLQSRSSSDAVSSPRSQKIDTSFVALEHPAATAVHSMPSPISESPIRETAMTEAVSPESVGTGRNPSPVGYVPPPIIDSSVGNPHPFTDQDEEDPSQLIVVSDPSRKPRAQRPKRPINTLTPAEKASVQELALNISGQSNRASSASITLGLQLLIDLQALLAYPIKVVFDVVIALDERKIRTFNDILDYVGISYYPINSMPLCLTRSSKALKEHLTQLKERTHALTLLSRLVAATQIYPKRLMVEPLQYQPRPKALGGFGTVHQAIDPSVCVKVIEVDTKPKSFAASSAENQTDARTILSYFIYLG
ncbi:hypothetical protein NP233_g8056 [Leucocoprinus birnbaumii]|uniref:Uncharacterized protein n=1 Tax=Leucocoprinus birnbaumii TaxID=56174 RepID=A0AAD5VTI9_9AGAR|nr:hypothetical protein NP233_g8056 [Leucocoprinus birnbaumii]